MKGGGEINEMKLLFWVGQNGFGGVWNYALE